MCRNNHILLSLPFMERFCERDIRGHASLIDLGGKVNLRLLLSKGKRLLITMSLFLILQWYLCGASESFRILMLLAKGNSLSWEATLLDHFYKHHNCKSQDLQSALFCGKSTALRDILFKKASSNLLQ